MSPLRFPIRIDPTSRVLLRTALVKPKDAMVIVDDAHVEVRMGWAFRARFPRSAVRTVGGASRRPLSRGVHGWNGRWLVNGSGEGIRVVQLAPSQRARVCGFPVKLRELWVSLEDPEAFQAALGGR